MIVIRYRFKIYSCFQRSGKHLSTIKRSKESANCSKAVSFLTSTVKPKINNSTRTHSYCSVCCKRLFELDLEGYFQDKFMHAQYPQSCSSTPFPPSTPPIPGWAGCMSKYCIPGWGRRNRRELMTCSDRPNRLH